VPASNAELLPPAKPTEEALTRVAQQAHRNTRKRFAVGVLYAAAYLLCLCGRATKNQEKKGENISHNIRFIVDE
jgi:hypothetical protein